MLNVRYCEGVRSMPGSVRGCVLYVRDCEGVCSMPGTERVCAPCQALPGTVTICPTAKDRGTGFYLCPGFEQADT